MKKSFIFLATAFLLNASVAKSYPPPHFEMIPRHSESQKA